MTEFTVNLAGVPIRILALHSGLKTFLREHLTEEEPEIVLEMTREDIERERRKSEENRQAEGLPAGSPSDDYLEILAVYRKLAEELIDWNVLLFHGSVIAVDGEAYLFTARSGTGKSTHTRLWREAFGDRAEMINDDKPLLRVERGSVLACGTPWNGKHRLGSSGSAPLKALCVLTRDRVNHIEAISQEEAFPILYQQCYHPERGEKIPRLLSLLEQLGSSVKLYRLGCNMDPEAALVAYHGMQEE